MDVTGEQIDACHQGQSYEPRRVWRLGPVGSQLDIDYHQSVDLS
jgi:hypothetical protein